MDLSFLPLLGACVSRFPLSNFFLACNLKAGHTLGKHIPEVLQEQLLPLSGARKKSLLSPQAQLASCQGDHLGQEEGGCWEVELHKAAPGPGSWEPGTQRLTRPGCWAPWE